MNHPKTIKAEKIPAEETSPKLAVEDSDETTQMIEEAAYYIGLERGRYSHPGDELNDWYQAEKAVRDNQ